MLGERVGFSRLLMVEEDTGFNRPDIADGDSFIVLHLVL